MLDQLELLASQLNTRYESVGKPPVAFAYGRMDQLNALISDKHVEGFLLFHEGYFQTTPSINARNGFVQTHALTLWLLFPSQFTDLPEQKRGNLAVLTPFLQDVFRELDKIGTIAGAQATMNRGLNLTDRNLDGIRLSLSLTPEPTYVC